MLREWPLQQFFDRFAVRENSSRRELLKGRSLRAVGEEFAFELLPCSYGVKSAAEVKDISLIHSFHYHLLA